MDREPEARGEDSFHGMIGRSPSMKRLIRQLEMVGGLDAPLLIEGEPGSGKTTAAQTVHEIGSRAHGAVIFLDSVMLQPSLCRHELFGDRDGAFPGAVDHPRGAARAADGGTLVIENLDRLPREGQRHLQHLLETATVTPHGSTSSHRVDLRLIATSCTSLAEQTADGRFDRQLYTCLQPFALRLPPLRRRHEDLPVLARHFLHRAMIAYAKELAGLSAEAERLLTAYPWPGNLRELAEEMERAVVLTPAGAEVEPQVLSESLVGSVP